MLKRTITVMLLITLLTTLFLPKYIYASQSPLTNDTYKQYSEEGKATGGINNETRKAFSSSKSVVPKVNGIDLIISMLCKFFSLIPTIIITILSLVTFYQNTGSNKIFSIKNTILGNIKMFDIDFFDIEYEQKSTFQEIIDSLIGKNDVNNAIKVSVAGWYYTIRNITITIELLVLLYIGIRMAISTVASDEAKYKKMLLNWLTSFILIFVLQFIIIIAIKISNGIVELFQVDLGDKDFEMIILKNHYGKFLKSSIAVYSLISTFALAIYQLKFFFIYLKRVIATAFLIMISPLITITYSIDKIGDNQAQALKNWLSEILVNIFIQPIHIFLYVVFLYSASQIAEVQPVIGLFFLFGLSRAEKILKEVFSMRQRESIHSMSETFKFSKEEENDS